MATLEKIWCSFMHDSPMWPIHGRYACRVCGREYPVAWSEIKATEKPQRSDVQIYRHAVAGSHR